MFTYGIAETGKRQMKRPQRARVIVARIDGWLMSTQGARVFFTVLACALTTLTALAITTERANFIETLVAIVSVFAILGVIGAMLVSDETSKRANKIWRDIFAREYNAQVKERNATIARADNAHALEIGKLSKQLLDERAFNETSIRNLVNTHKRKIDEMNALVNKVQLGAHNLAWALVEDSDMREITANHLSKIASEIPSNERAQVFANVVLYDYAQDGLYAYDATLNAKIENGLVDYDNYNRARD